MERVVVMTGATGGIGKVVLRELLDKGYTIYAACRGVGRLQEFAEHVPTRLHPVELDLESLASAIRFCNEIEKSLSGRPIEIIINNAGMIAPRLERSIDGYERSLQVNYIAPKVITERLCSLLAPRGKVINTLSCTIKKGRFVTVQRAVAGKPVKESTLMSLKHYSDAKYMMALYTINFALEHKEITVCGADPGIVNTGIITMHRWYDPLANILFRPFIKSPAQGALSILNAVEYIPKGDNGGKALLFKGRKTELFGKRFYAEAEEEKTAFRYNL